MLVIVQSQVTNLTFLLLIVDGMHLDVPCDRAGVPSRRNISDDMIHKSKWLVLDSQLKERDEVAIHGEALGVGRLLGPCAPVHVEHVVEQPGGDLSCHRTPTVEQL